MKKFTVNCDFGGQMSPFTIYIGQPEKKHHPLHFQADWLSKQRGGSIPPEIMDSVSKLQELAEKNDVLLAELCVYALGSENENEGGDHQLEQEEHFDNARNLAMQSNDDTSSESKLINEEQDWVEDVIESEFLETLEKADQVILDDGEEENIEDYMDDYYDEDESYNTLDEEDQDEVDEEITDISTNDESLDTEQHVVDSTHTEDEEIENMASEGGHIEEDDDLDKK